MEKEKQGDHLTFEEATELVKFLGSDADSKTEKDAYRILLAHALTAMPKDVASTLPKNCVFRDFVKENDAGFVIPCEERKNKHWIFINGERIKMKKEDALSDILHELAHLFLGHNSESKMREREKEAEEKEKEWFSFWEKNHDEKLWNDFKQRDCEWAVDV
jgi:hypothetical protein